MPRIKIISDQEKPSVPKSVSLSETVPRFRPPGGKPPIQFDKVYNRQDGKNPL